MKNFSSLIILLIFLQSCELISAWEDRPDFGDDIVLHIMNEMETEETLFFKYSSGFDPGEAIENPAFDSMTFVSLPYSDTSLVWHDPMPDTGIGWALVKWEGQFKVLTGYGRALEDLHLDIFLQGDSISVSHSDEMD